MGYPDDTKTVGKNVFLIILGVIVGAIGLVEVAEFINALIYG